jgi:hypothetical protein
VSFACLGGLVNDGWRGALWFAQRQALLRGEGLCEPGRHLPAEAGMRAFGVVILAPGRERGAGVVQGRDAAEKLDAWRRYYNEERPHGVIGNKIPFMLTKSGGVTSPSP